VHLAKALIFFGMMAGTGSCACSSTPCPAPTGEARWQDNWVHLQRLPGSSFIEVLEVRAGQGGRVFFCTGVQGLVVVDASNPSAMEQVHRLSDPLGSGAFPRCQHLALTDQKVFFSNRGDEIQPIPFVAGFDLGSGEPRPLGTFRENDVDFPGFEGLAAQGDRIFAAAHQAGLYILRSQRGTLEREQVVGGLENAWAVALTEEHAWVADGLAGLKAIHLAGAGAPQVVGALELAGSAQSVAASADATHLFVGAGASGLHIVSVEDPTQPKLIATVDTPGSVLQVAVDGELAYLADWNDIRVYDVKDPSNPTLLATEKVATTKAFSRVLGISARDGIAFVGEWAGFHSFELRPKFRAPDIAVEKKRVDFGHVPVGQMSSEVLVLRNEGQEKLIIGSITPSNSVFSVTPQDLMLEPGEADVVEIQLGAQAFGPMAGELKICSDDPDQAEVTITLQANQPGVGVGDDAPEAVVELLGGGLWESEKHAGHPVVLAYFATF
jgi:hypothetical protein